MRLDDADVVHAAGADLDDLAVHQRLDQLGRQLHVVNSVVVRRVQRWR